MRSDAAGPGDVTVVEVVGAPGAGKTTLTALLRDELDRRAVAADTVVGRAREHAARTRPGRIADRVRPARLRRALLWQVFYATTSVDAACFAREHAALARCAIASQRGRPLPVRRKAHVLYWFFQLGGRLRFLHRTGRPGEVVVVDDGFLQRTAHLYASHVEEPRRDAVDAYVALVPPPDLVVHVTAPDDVCARRVLDRGLWAHSRRLTRTDVERLVAASRHAVTRATEAARRRGVPVVQVPNGDGGGRGLDRAVAAVVTEWLAPSPAAPREEVAR